MQALPTSSSSSTLATDSTSSSDTTTSLAAIPTASQKKLNYLELRSSDSDDDLPASKRGRIFELPSLQEALYSGVCCFACYAGNIELKEYLSSKQGLYTAPYLYCSNCQKTTPISFNIRGSNKTLAINIKLACALAVMCFNDGSASLANVCDIMKIPLSKYRRRYLKKKGRARVRRSVLKCSTKGKAVRRAARRRRKGYEDKKSEGLMYSTGAFDNETESVK